MIKFWYQITVLCLQFSLFNAATINRYVINGANKLNVFLLTAKHANEVLTDINRLMEI